MAKLDGGAKLRAVLADLSAKVDKSGTLNVGFLEGSTESLNNLPSAQVAFWAEFGTKTEPPRPFFRPMIAKESSQWGSQMAAALKASGYNVDRTLGQMGEVISGELQESITQVMAPPLSPVTLMLRKMRKKDSGLIVTGKVVAEARKRVADGESTSGVSAKPLVDTGDMLKAVAYEVKP